MAASVVISINRDNATLSTCGVAVSAAARATICSNVVCSGIAWRSTTFNDWLRVKRRAEVCFLAGGTTARIREYTATKADVDQRDRPDHHRIFGALRFGIGKQRGEFLLEGDCRADPRSQPVHRSGRNILTS